jgi:hypothetical protein
MYIVEVEYGTTLVPLACTIMTRWGGVQNFEEYRLRSYNASTATDVLGAAYKPYHTRVGDMVVVSCIRGQSREGIILGAVSHPGRKSKLKPDNLEYRSQFNGIETTITKAGGYRVTNNAIVSTPLDVAIPGAPIPPEVKNPVVSGTYFEIGDDGSWSATDGKKQLIKIDKSGLKTTITSGKNSITLEVAGGTSLAAVKLDVESTTDINIKTKQLNVESALTAKIKSPKIAIGNSTFELIDGLIKLIDAFGTLIVTSPTGPCTALQAAPTWSQIVALKTKLQAIKGSL